MWTLACDWVSGLLGTLVGMAGVASSDVAPDASVPEGANGSPSTSAAPVAASGRRVSPPRPRDGEVDDAPVGVVRAATERTPLTDRERAMLEFERFWWRHAGAKEQAIRETFDLSATHYYRLLNALLDQPAAVEFDPLVVGRLRRLRASRTRRRAGR
jgi:Protein of unknown function (DUF3263)